MINIGGVKYFCSEDISLIENYDKAISDTTQTWDCHHRRETDEGLSKNELIKMNAYYHRPACELIFLTKKEHLSLHFKGDKNPGKNKSTETKQKMSESHKGLQSGENHPMYGKHHSEEVKQKMSESHKGKIFSEETKQKLSELHKGKHLSEETKIKIANGNKGKIISKETREKISKIHKGKHRSEEAKIKQSKTMKNKPSPIKGKHRVYNKDGSFHFEL